MLSTSRTSLRRTALGMLAALVVATAVAVPSASATGGGTISGTVTDAATGVPLAGISVSVNEETSGWSMTAQTDANGFYTIDVVAQGGQSGTYSVFVGGVNGPYSGHYAQVPSDYFTYTDGQTITGKDVALERYPAVSGLVVGPGAIPFWAGFADLIATDTGQPAAGTVVGTDGSFWIDTSGIQSGRYTVRITPFSGGTGIATWLGGVASMVDAPTVYLNPGDERALPSIQVLDGSKISGTVSATTCEGEVWGNPTTFRGQVTVYDAQAPHASHGNGGSVDVDGNYTVDALPPGDYTVVFEPADAGCRLGDGQKGQWWSGDSASPASLPTSATVVSLGLHDSVSNVDATLVTAGSRIRGVVKDSAGAPVVGVAISLTAADGSFIDRVGTAVWAKDVDYGTLFHGSQVGPGLFQDGTTSTGADGSFEVASVGAGTYDIYIGGGLGRTGTYTVAVASSFHDGTAFPEDSAGVTVNGTDPVDVGVVTMAEGGSISGTLTPDSTVYMNPNMSHTALLVAFQYNVTAGKWEAMGTSYPVELGGETPQYTIPGLASGVYKVGAFYDMPADGFASTFYGNTLNFDAAAGVTVVAGQATPGIDFTLSALGPVEQNRYAGAGRYQTSVAISKTFAPGASVAYVASGENFPDALAAAPAAADAGGPLLITASTSLPAEIKAELIRLEPTRIVVVGGTAAVSQAVYDELAGVTGSGGIKRVSGADRYATARAIVTDHWGSATVNRVYVASGENFPDALSAAAAAGAMGVPVITVAGSATDLDPAVSTLIESLGATEIAVAGGTSAVSAGVFSDLSAVPGVTATWRYAGANRYATGAAINHDAFSGSDLVYVASGNNFPDALSGAAIAGRDKAPLYIVPGTCITRSVVDDIRNFGATKVTVLGGTAVVSVDLSKVTICP